MFPSTRRGKDGNKNWYPGYVKGYNEDGTYFIKFDDNDEAQFVPDCDIELLSPPSGTNFIFMYSCH